jgi:hypothetical protein
MHMSSDEPDHDVPRVHFFLEHNWAKEFCKSPICNEAIEWGKYRIAVVPGEKTLAGVSSAETFSVCVKLTAMIESYHVRCFEELADFSQEDYLDRLRPLIHSTAVTLRGLKESSDWHKRWYLDAGTMRLVLEWKTLMKFLLCAKSSMASGCLPEVFDLSAIVQNKGPVEYLPDELEAYIQTPIDDPTECDGPEDQEPWNLFERYMSLTAKSIGKLKDFKDLRDLEKRHTLSEMLESWSKDQASAKTLLYRDLGTNTLLVVACFWTRLLP